MFNNPHEGPKLRFCDLLENRLCLFNSNFQSFKHTWGLINVCLVMIVMKTLKCLKSIVIRPSTFFKTWNLMKEMFRIHS